MARAMAEPKYLEAARLIKSGKTIAEVAEMKGVSRLCVHSYIHSFNNSNAPCAMAAREELGEIATSGRRRRAQVETPVEVAEEAEEVSGPVAVMTHKNSTFDELAKEVCRIMRELALVNFEEQEKANVQIKLLREKQDAYARGVSDLRMLEEVNDKPVHVSSRRAVEV
jgi:hypothetical protein